MAKTAKPNETRRSRRISRYRQAERGERPWGAWDVLAIGRGYVVKRLVIKPGQRISLQFHRHRSENWIIADGKARVQIGDSVSIMRAGAGVQVPRRAVHRLANAGRSPLVIIEVQRGTRLDEKDIVRLADDHGR